jgi:hypothetical protein
MSHTLLEYPKRNTAGELCQAEGLSIFAHIYDSRFHTRRFVI